MRRYQKIIMAMILITFFILAGIPPIDPIRVNGQTKERTILSQESGRDPFLLPPGVHLLSKIEASLGVKGGPSRTEPDMRVKAILISDHIRLALIDRHIVTVGDSIHGEKVLEIKTDRVVLGKGEQKRTLLLSQSPVLLTVEAPRPLPCGVTKHPPQGKPSLTRWEGRKGQKENDKENSNENENDLYIFSNSIIDPGVRHCPK